MLLLAERSDAAGRYRCSHAAEQLRVWGVGADVASALDADVEDRIRRCRVVIFHRVGLDGYTERLYRRARMDGRIAVFDTDDLVFDVEAMRAVPHRLYGNDRIRAMLVEEEARRQRRAMTQADAVLVATDYLAEEARKVGTPTWVHRNGFSLEMLRASANAARRRRHERDGATVIGYASGTPTHDRDFGVAKSALLHILEKYQDVEVWLVGPVDPGNRWGRAEVHIRRRRGVPWHALPDVLAQFDVNIAPLESQARFCRGKSEVKYIESGLVRVVTVASTGSGYDQAIRSGENGLLASSTEEWVAHLERLIRDRDLRRTLGERAYTDVVEHYHPRERGRELVSTLNEVGRAVRGSSPWADAGTWRPVERLEESARERSAFGMTRVLLIRRGILSLRYRGIRIVLLELWVYMRGRWRGLIQRGSTAN